MSRASTMNPRNLTLTEELEKLEQSITLTLQGKIYSCQCNSKRCGLTTTTEIDHNFSRAHRIVTSSILPIVEQYAEHSKNVWEGSKVSFPVSFSTTTDLMSLLSSGNNSSKPVPMFLYPATKSTLPMRQSRKTPRPDRQMHRKPTPLRPPIRKTITQ